LIGIRASSSKIVSGGATAGRAYSLLQGQLPGSKRGWPEVRRRVGAIAFAIAAAGPEYRVSVDSDEGERLPDNDTAATR
jgi:hypothetical protein